MHGIAIAKVWPLQPNAADTQREGPCAMMSGALLNKLYSARRIRPSMSGICRLLSIAVVLSTWLGGASLAQQALQAGGAATLFQNVRIFDGKSATLSCLLQRLGARQQDRINLATADSGR
ncbi:hypothetical protein ABIF91_001342 [Bradyrhizobium sp. USDA 241]